jgi:CheY-like chemotaxis protein
MLLRPRIVVPVFLALVVMASAPVAFARGGNYFFEGGTMLRSVCDVLIDAGVDVVTRATNGDEAVTKIEATRPAVAVLDVRMPRLTGIEVASQVSRTTPETAVIL